MYSVSDILRVLWYMSAGVYNPYYDFNQDGVIDKLDLMFLRSMSWFEVLML